MNYTSRDLSKLFNNLRETEEASISSSSFVGSMAKVYKYGLLITSVIGIGMGFFLIEYIQDFSVGMIFGIIGIIALLMLPTYFSYRCYVDKNIINEQYYLLCFKINKDVYWKDIKYKRVKRDANGDACTIKLYNVNKKKLISISNEVIGLGIIVRMSKGIPTLKH